MYDRYAYDAWLTTDPRDVEPRRTNVAPDTIYDARECDPLPEPPVYAGCSPQAWARMKEMEAADRAREAAEREAIYAGGAL